MGDENKAPLLKNVFFENCAGCKFDRKRDASSRMPYGSFLLIWIITLATGNGKILDFLVFFFFGRGGVRQWIFLGGAMVDLFCFVLLVRISLHAVAFLDELGWCQIWYFYFFLFNGWSSWFAYDVKSNFRDCDRMNEICRIQINYCDVKSHIKDCDGMKGMRMGRSVQVFGQSYSNFWIKKKKIILNLKFSIGQTRN